MPTSARQATPRPPAERLTVWQYDKAAWRSSGFTLIELLLALSIVALVAAVALPSIAHRLDAAFAEADLQQAKSSAEMLPARVSTLGIDWRLDASTIGRAMPDGVLPLDIPRAWVFVSEKPVLLTRTGSCEAGSWLLQEPLGGRRWRFAIAELTCEVSAVELTESDK
jgi:prepilin-type N-terminal cleavage/methylation domain-containing protein